MEEMIRKMLLDEEEILIEYLIEYSKNNNEIESLTNLNLTYQDLKNFKKNKIYVDMKELIDDYNTSKIEDKLYEEAQKGSIKAIELILKTKSKNFKKTESNYSNQVTDFIGALSE